MKEFQLPIKYNWELAHKEISANESQFKYEIGEYVPSEGGVIAHRWLSATAGGPPSVGTIQNYLVLDTQDVSNGAPWATLFSNISNVESKWNGQSNTSNLIAAGPAAGITPGTAATACDSSTRNGKSDWYLPAIDELNKVWDNRWEIAQGLEDPSIIPTAPGGTSIKDGQYWSSTEYSNSSAWYFLFSYGYADYDGKDNTYYVRAVRKFSI